VSRRQAVRHGGTHSALLRSALLPSPASSLPRELVSGRHLPLPEAVGVATSAVADRLSGYASSLSFSSFEVLMKAIMLFMAPRANCQLLLQGAE